MWFHLQATDLAFTTSAPFRFDTVCVLPAGPERVFQAFSEPRDLARFIAGFRRCEWKTAEPHGVGAVRELDLQGVSFREHFVAWEPGRRFCFAVDALTLPAMRRMIEDIRIEPWSGGKARLIWSVYYHPSALTRAVHAFVRFGLELGYRRSVESLDRHLMAHPEHDKGSMHGIPIDA
jgi:Polyketide cyclase / dehydrase and lipid transport